MSHRPDNCGQLTICSPGLPPGKGTAVGTHSQTPRDHCRPLGPGSDKALGGPFPQKALLHAHPQPSPAALTPGPEAGASFRSPPLRVRWQVLGLACRALHGSLWTPHPPPCPPTAQHQPSQDTHHPLGQLHLDPLWSTACLLPNPRRLCFTSEARGDPPSCPGHGRAASGGWREVGAPPSTSLGGTDVGAQPAMPAPFPRAALFPGLAPCLGWTHTPEGRELVRQHQRC